MSKKTNKNGSEPNLAEEKDNVIEEKDGAVEEVSSDPVRGGATEPAVQKDEKKKNQTYLPQYFDKA